MQEELVTIRILPWKYIMELRNRYFKNSWRNITFKQFLPITIMNPMQLKEIAAIKKLLAQRNINFKSYKDQVIFEKDEVLKDDGKPYTVYTPYSKKWKDMAYCFYMKAYPVKKYFNNFFKQPPRKVPSLDSMGFNGIDKKFPSKESG